MTTKHTKATKDTWRGLPVFVFFVTFVVNQSPKEIPIRRAVWSRS